MKKILIFYGSYGGGHLSAAKTISDYLKKNYKEEFEIKLVDCIEYINKYLNKASTEAYKEFEEKSKDWTEETAGDITKGLMLLFVEFGEMKELDPADENVQAQVKKLQDFITEHYYTCTNQILSGLGQMYVGGGEFTENIDSYGGEGTAEFANAAIQIYCGK